MDQEERKVLEVLDTTLGQQAVRAAIGLVVRRVEEKLIQDPLSVLAWEPIPLSVYGGSLPRAIRSSWVFVLRAKSTTGAERHPNSHQRMMSYQGVGDLQTRRGRRWRSNALVSDSNAGLERRWVSIPPGTWHQAVVPGQHWAVVSFHTVSADELIEERPDPADERLTHQRRYLA